VVRDLHRIRQLRALAGTNVELMVDANGGYSPGQARRVGAALDELGVTWFEEPISSDDTSGLGLLRQALRCDIAAGEYVSDVYDAARLAPVVDCLQLDATRCGGYTGWLRCAAVAAAHNLQVSAHCAPALHIPVAAAVPNLRHLEYFIDHVRLEPLLLQGVPERCPAREHHRAGARDDAEPGRGGACRQLTCGGACCRVLAASRSNGAPPGNQPSAQRAARSRRRSWSGAVARAVRRSRCPK